MEVTPENVDAVVDVEIAPVPASMPPLTSASIRVSVVPAPLTFSVADIVEFMLRLNCRDELVLEALEEDTLDASHWPAAT